MYLLLAKLPHMSLLKYWSQEPGPDPWPFWFCSRPRHNTKASIWVLPAMRNLQEQGHAPWTSLLYQTKPQDMIPALPFPRLQTRARGYILVPTGMYLPARTGSTRLLALILVPWSLSRLRQNKIFPIPLGLADPVYLALLLTTTKNFLSSSFFPGHSFPYSC